LEYGGDTQRVLKNYTSGTSTNSRLYLHGANDYPLMEKNKTSATAETLAVYIYGFNGVVAKRVGSTVLFLLKDHLGSTRVAMDATGLVRTYYDYDALGNIIRIGTTNEVKYQFTGQEVDESALHNFRARLYDSDLGKFYAADPAGQFANPYSHAGNNPVVIVDPDGQFAWFVPILIGAGIGAIGGGISAERNGGEWWQGALAGAVVGGAAGYFAGAALAPVYPGASSPLFAGLTVKGAIAGAGIGTAWGMADASSGKTSWGNVLKYGITGGLAGATIGFGAETGMFSFSPKALSWKGFGNSALFWSGAFASANSMESIEHGYLSSIAEGAAAGLVYGGVSYGYVGLTDKLGSMAGLGKWGGYALRTPINIAIARHAQAESKKQKLPGVDHAVVGAFLAGIPCRGPRLFPT